MKSSQKHSLNIMVAFKHKKWLVNGFQNFWKWNISWNILHKVWHNTIKKQARF
jgi:hypothetical protein